MKETTGNKKIFTPKSILLYGICAVLVAFYLVVLYLGANPNVGLEYRMYYLTHELTDWPGYGNLNYDLGTLEYCTGNYGDGGKPVDYPVANRKGQGWDVNEYSDSKLKEDVAYLYYIPNQSKSDGTFMVNILTYDGEADTDVYVGDTCIGSFEGAGKHEFKVPEIVEDEMLVIRFETEGSRFAMYQVMLG